MKNETAIKSPYALLLLLALGVGSLLSITLFHLLPEALGELGTVKALLFVALGYGILFLVSWSVHRSCMHRHHKHDIACDHHDPMAGVAVNMVASCAHSLQDGLMLGASFLQGAPYGIAALYSTLLHEIPKKLGDFSFLRPRLCSWKTLALLALTVLVTLLSAAFVYSIKFQIEETPWFTALLAGAFAYYVCGHMLPDLLNRVRSMPAKKYPAIITGTIGLIGMSLIMRWLDSGH